MYGIHLSEHLKLSENKQVWITEGLLYFEKIFKHTQNCFLGVQYFFASLNIVLEEGLEGLLNTVQRVFLTDQITCKK